MAVDLVGCSNHRWIGSVLPLPGVETHHRDRRHAFPVASIGEQTATPGGNAKRLEKIAGDVLAVARLDRGRRTGAPHAQGYITDLERRQVLERRGIGAEELVRFPREETPVVQRQPVAVSLRVPVRVAAEDSIADAPELVGPLERQRPQHHLLHKRENRRSRPDAKSEGEDGYGGENGGPGQQAGGVARSPEQRPPTCSFLLP